MYTGPMGGRSNLVGRARIRNKEIPFLIFAREASLSLLQFVSLIPVMTELIHY